MVLDNCMCSALTFSEIYEGKSKFWIYCQKLEKLFYQVTKIGDEIRREQKAYQAHRINRMVHPNKCIPLTQNQ